VNATIAAQMTAADLLKLRKRRGTVAWALLVALLPVVLFFTVKAIQHSSNPGRYGPAGGIEGFRHGLMIVGLLFGPLAAILIGVEAGASDSSAGLFRDLVATGRSRLALFATRLPAALAVCWTVITLAFALVVLGTFVFAGGLPTPSGALLGEAFGFTLLGTGAICAVAVGFASLTNSKASSITALVGWTLIASPLIASISSLGVVRNGLLEQAILHFRPLGDLQGHGGIVSISTATALVVLACWLAVFLALGAWRTRTMDT
jgi:ABC-type transport system involved in multi-copper enzyme maturation permease subunit